MKIIKNITEVYEYDVDGEIARINELFEGDTRQRLLDITNMMFVEKDFEKTRKLFDELPYDETEECPETEYLGDWVNIFEYGCPYYLKDVDITYNF